MTKIEFRSFDGGYCAFTDDSVIFSDSLLREAKVFPLGSIKKLTAFRGVKLTAHNGETCFFSFLHMRKRIKRKLKELVERVNAEKTNFEQAEPYTIEIDETKKESIEQIRKPHFSCKKAIKFAATLIASIFTALVVLTLILGLANEYSDSSKPNSQYNEVRPNWQEQWK